MSAGTANKLEINSTYLLFTTYGTISNLKVTVKGILNYEQAQKIPYALKNLAINEKVIDLTNENTIEYFKDQLYYLCVSINANGNEDQYIVWDDIIDSYKTTKTNAKYMYSLELDVNSDLITDLPTIEKSITTFINSTYGSNVTPNLISNGEVKKITDEKTAQLEEYKEKYNDAISVINKLASLKQIESLIDLFAKDDMYEKIQDISTSLETIQNTISTISSMIS